MITFESSGSFKKTDTFLRKMSGRSIFRTLEKYAKEGVAALESATPVDSGITANAWDYTIEHKRDTYAIHWTNSHTEGGAPVAILLQYGHGTGTGGYVRGKNYINPALKPIFARIEADVWKAVTSA